MEALCHSMRFVPLERETTMKHQIATLSLWLIAIAATFLMIHEQRIITVLGPVYAVCMIGSVVTVRAAARRLP